MSLVVTNEGEKTLLSWALKSAGDDLTLRLFSNDVTPVPGSVAGDFTEASFTGYTARSLTRASLGAPGTNADGKAEATYPDQTYDFGSSEAIYGYYLADSGGNLIAAERYAQVRNQQTGDQYVVTPRLVLASDPTRSTVICNAGEITLLDWILRSAGGDVVLRLYKNAYTPIATSQASDFTEADFGGYTSRTLARASWNAPTTDANGHALIEYNTEQTFSPTSDQSIHGFYVTDSLGNLLWAQEYSDVRNLITGENFIVRPLFSFRSES